MLTIHITQEFTDSNQMADGLETIATRVRHGVAQGRWPDYHVTSDE